MLVVGDLGYGMIESFIAKCPKQYVNAGVAEQDMIGIATGLALEGKIVFAYSIANFAVLRCLEQIRNDAAYHDANLKIVAMGGGFSYGALGMSHHATEDLAIVRAMPNITMFTPGDDWEVVQAVEMLVRTPGTGYVRLDKMSAGNTSKKDEQFILGKARILTEGNALTFVTCGGILKVVLEVAEELRKKDDIQVRVMSCPTMKPFDREAILNAAQETGGIVTVEEHTLEGGLGGLVAEILMDTHVIPQKFLRMGLKAGFSSIVGSQTYLQEKYGLGRDSIRQSALDLIRS